MSRPLAALLAATSEEEPLELPAEIPPPPSLAALASRVGADYEGALAAYRGPTPRSNWIVPRRLLCGERPHEHLGELCAAGVTTFVTLQAKGESPSYVHGVRKQLGDVAKFLTLPIPDQRTTADEQISALALEILRRCAAGEVLYVHCRGGHGRTGTICSLLLAALHGIDGPAALATYQALHDLRTQPCFAARSYAVTPDGACCLALFPEQRDQVLRLVAAGGGAPDDIAGAPDGEGGGSADAPLAPPPASKDLSGTYGRGASQYEEATLHEWRARGESAAAAAKRRDWSTACAEFEACVSLRPDWQKGLACLAKAQEKAAAAAPAPAAAPATDDTDDTDDTVGEASRSAGGSIDQPIDQPAAAGAAGTGGAARPPLGPHVPSVVVLVGLPGAGKTTFATALASGRDEWQLLDSDQLGGKRAFEEGLGAACKHVSAARKHGSHGARSRLVIDKCNVRAADRASLLELALPLLPAGCAPAASRARSGGVGATPIVAVYFAADTPTCVERVAARTDHPTIQFGRGRPAVEAMAKALELPPAVAAVASSADAAASSGGRGGGVEAEGMRWLVVRSPEEANALLASWGGAAADVAPSGFYKFPRTRHVLNTGGSAVSRDDLVMEPGLAARFFDGRTVIVADEKVDGSNLGLSLTRDFQILCQNRSHFVNTHSHAQWRPLGGWLDEHGWALCQLLEPEVEVLFGEWVVAKHSRAYTRLPGYFIAFDIYNKRTGSFASAHERNRRLAGLGIPVVRTLARRAFRSSAELLALLESPSAYLDGFVEGAYLRIDSDAQETGAAACATGGVNLMRGKIVRPDFIQGIEEHWMTSEIVRNGVRPDLWVDSGEEAAEVH